MANSTLANALDYDDDLVGSFGAATTPSGLAVGDNRGVRGRELITSKGATRVTVR